MRRPCPHCGAQNILERTICHECRQPLPPIPDPEPVLSEIAMTEAVRACLAARSAKHTRYAIAGLAAFGVGALVIEVQTSLQVFTGDNGEAFALVCGSLPSGIGLLAALFFWQKIRAARADAEDSTYCRATGRVSFHVEGEAGLQYIRAGKSAKIRFLDILAFDEVRRKLEGLPGIIEYARHSEFLLEVRDADDQLLYRYSGYRPDGLVRPMARHAHDGGSAAI